MEKILGVEHSKIPTLNIGYMNGVTDYLDFIELDQMTAPVMKGYDYKNRAFVAVKMIGVTEKGNVDLFQTFFQRFQDNKTMWMGCGHGGTNLLNTEGGMNDNHFHIIRDICAGKIVCNVNKYDFVHLAPVFEVESSSDSNSIRSRLTRKNN